MSSLQTVLFIFQIIVSVLLILLVLVQNSDEDSLSGIGASSSTGIFSQKAAESFLTKSTMILFVLFMLNSLFLATIAMRNSGTTKTKAEQFIEKQEETKIPEATK